MTSPVVSVLLPVWNADPDFLRQALTSLLAQTLSDMEVVVVEDPSPRCAGDLLQSLRDPRIRHLRSTQRTSFAGQLNRGLAAARAPYVARMDADDVAEPERLLRQMKFLQSHPDVGVLGTQLRIIDEAERPLGYRAYPTEHGDIVRALRRFNPIAHPSVMFRKAVVLRVGGYRFPALYPCEDYDLWCRLAKAGARFANSPEALLRYRIHTGSSKSVATKSTLRHTLAIKRKYWRGQMGLVDRLWMWGERLLQFLPATVIQRLFLHCQLCQSLPGKTSALPGAGTVCHVAHQLAHRPHDLTTSSTIL